MPIFTALAFMMKGRATCVLLIVTLFSAYYCCAQGQNNFWAFGWNCGLDFSSGTPVWVKTKIQTSEGCGAVCDNAGRLLFYTSGNYIINRNGDTMANSIGMLGNSGGNAVVGSAVQGVTIIPFINDTDRYYVFTTDCVESHSPAYPGYLRYTVVDMRLNGGMGDVDLNYKNIILDSFISEKAYPAHGAGCYDWLITHKYASKYFVAFRIGVNGVDPVPVLSPASLFADSTNEDSYVTGELKVSQDDKWIANTDIVTGAVELSSFDNATGIVSNTRLVDHMPFSAVGVSFSPDGSKLYADHWYHGMVQYNLSLLPDINAVTSSRTVIGDSGVYNAMRLGPDNKLYINYINGTGRQVLRVINQPNAAGAACDPTELDPPVDSNMFTAVTLGNPVIRSFNVKTKSFDTSLCAGTPLTLFVPAGYDNYTWSDGSTQTSETFSNTATAWVCASSLCAVETDTFNIKAGDCNCIVAIPTAFSPNNDGKNDRFKVQTGDVVSFHMEVHNRWGQSVFYTSDIHHSWDGTYNNRICDADTYYYFVKLECLSGKTIFREGDVTLLR
ncbi:MAG: gliding motility-associated C-terminal domain-containing protein [Bacteroidetes bacterium]|nr:gliding motility-associated C-terminal domain-containing protein [Bacteroidota bacterium]